MAFNLKLVLKALLFSSNQPLTIKDIQAVFTRFHEKAQVPASLAEGGDAAEVPADDAEVAAAALNPVEGAAEAGIVEGGALSLTPEDPELYSEVPALIT
jgi:segregation and condensation protein B